VKYSLTYETRPWTLNVERQGNRWRRAALVKEWRDAFGALARFHKVPALDAIEVVAMPELRNRSAIPDTGACIGAVKAAIDGLVDAGVLVDDGPTIVRSLHFCAPRVSGRDALTVVVLPIEVPEARVS
jgi:hypothetical protein